VSGQVASHARQRPRDQGTCVTQSGRLPLPVHSECGSRVASVPIIILLLLLLLHVLYSIRLFVHYFTISDKLTTPL